jgi:hypothetical protein
MTMELDIRKLKDGDGRFIITNDGTLTSAAAGRLAKEWAKRMRVPQRRGGAQPLRLGCGCTMPRVIMVVAMALIVALCYWLLCAGHGVSSVDRMTP